MHGDHPDRHWNPKKFLGLCSIVVEKEDAELLLFCSDVENAMFRIAFDHVYQKL